MEDNALAIVAAYSANFQKQVDLAPLITLQIGQSRSSQADHYNISHGLENFVILSTLEIIVRDTSFSFCSYLEMSETWSTPTKLFFH